MSKELKILLASPRGFCAGVDRAIEIVEKALKKFGSPVYVRHEIVHNKYVVDSLKKEGAIFVEELNEIQNKISKLSIEFSNNINTHMDTLFIERALMEGLPEDFKNERDMESGFYALDLSYPTFYPYMKYADSDSIRKLLRKNFFLIVRIFLALLELTKIYT